MLQRSLFMIGAALESFLIRGPTPSDYGILSMFHLSSGRSSRDKKDHTRVRGRAYSQHGRRECARRVRQMANQRGAGVMLYRLEPDWKRRESLEADGIEVGSHAVVMAKLRQIHHDTDRAAFLMKVMLVIALACMAVLFIIAFGVS